MRTSGRLVTLSAFSERRHGILNLNKDLARTCDSGLCRLAWQESCSRRHPELGSQQLSSTQSSLQCPRERRARLLGPVTLAHGSKGSSCSLCLIVCCATCSFAPMPPFAESDKASLKIVSSFARLGKQGASKALIITCSFNPDEGG